MKRFLQSLGFGHSAADAKETIPNSPQSRRPYVNLTSLDFDTERAAIEKVRKKAESVLLSTDSGTSELFADLSAGRYERGEEIGRGGTAIVYKAIDTTFRRPVAMKRFSSDYASGINSYLDFLAEIESVSRIQHRNVVQTYDIGKDEEGVYLIMELIKGQDLEQHLLENPLSFAQFRTFVVQTLEGLIATHKGGILHLDLKPSNIMISGVREKRLTATLVDYGRARMIDRIKDKVLPQEDEKLIGSIHFMSPEQFKKKDVSEKSDLYSLGCVFYSALTGRRPFEGDTAILVMSAHLQSKVVPLGELRKDLDPKVCDWVMSLFAKDPVKRPGSAEDALDQFLELAVEN